MYSNSSFFDVSINVYSDINLTTPYPDGAVYYNGGEYLIGSGVVTPGGNVCLPPYCESECTSYTNYEISNNSYSSIQITFTLNSCNEITLTVPPLTLIYVNSNTVPVIS
jgi:hypothetical protein